MHKKLHRNISVIVASLIAIEGVLLMSSCSSDSSVADSSEGEILDEITIQADTTSATEVENMDTALMSAEGDTAGDNRWYTAEKTENGPAFAYLSDDYGYNTHYFNVRDYSTIYTGTDSSSRMYICESVSDNGNPLITVKDTTNGDVLGTIDTASAVYDSSWRSYYPFVYNDTPYVEIDILNNYDDIQSVEFYEIDAENMTIGEQVDLFPGQNLAITKAVPLPDGICFLTKEGTGYTDNYIRIYDNTGNGIITMALAEVFGNDGDISVQTIFPLGSGSVYMSAFVSDEDFRLCSAVVDYGPSDNAGNDISADLFNEKCYVSPDGEVYVLSESGISRLTADGSLELYIDFNNIYGEAVGVRGANAYIESVNEDGSVSLVGYEFSANYDMYCYNVELEITDENYYDRIPIDVGVLEANLLYSYYPELVAAFNDSNDTYYARLVIIDDVADYDTLFDTASIEDAGSYLVAYYNVATVEDDMLIQELKSDSAPDVYLSTGIENSLILGGVFQDVSEYINELLAENSEMYFDNIITAPANRNGELYQVPLKFYISGVFSDADTNEGIALGDSGFSSYENRVTNEWNGINPIRGYVGNAYYPVELIETHLNYYFDGENYDEEALRNLFDYLMTLPAQDEDSIYTNSVYQSAFSILDLYYYTLISFEDIDTYVTVPGPDGTSFGAVAGAMNTASVVANTDQIDGAIAFLKFALGYEAQTLEADAYGMPVQRNAFEAVNAELAAECVDESNENASAEAQDFLIQLIESVDNNSFYIVDTRLGIIVSDILNQTSEDASDLASEVNARYQEQSN